MSCRVKVGSTYNYEGKPVKVLQRIKGGPSKKFIYDSGIIPSGYHHKESKYMVEGFSDPIPASQLKTILNPAG